MRSIRTSIIVAAVLLIAGCGTLMKATGGPDWDDLSAEQKAFATYGQYVVAKKVGLAVIRRPEVSASAAGAFGSAVSVGDGAAETLLESAVSYRDIREAVLVEEGIAEKTGEPVAATRFRQAAAALARMTAATTSILPHIAAISSSVKGL